MGKTLKISLLIVGVLIIIGGVFGGIIFFKAEKEEVVEEEGYSTVFVMPQEKISVDGVVRATTDKSYFYNSEMGTIEQVAVVDGQKVNKGDLLYTYTASAADEELADLKREQTNLYNQRESYVSSLQELTGAVYNNQGDRLTLTWSNGASYYVVAEEIGVASPVSVGNNDDESDKETIAPDGTKESLKDAIRQLNSQIRELEIKLVRAQEKANPSIVADYAGKVTLNMAGKDDTSIPLVRIVGDSYTISGSVDEYNYHILKEGMPVDIYVNAEDRQVKGKVNSIDRMPISSNQSSENSANTTGDTSGAKFGFTVVPSDFIQPGFSVQVSLPQKGFVLPEEVFVEEDNERYVFKYVDGKVQKTKVKLEKIGLQEVVVDGIKEGDEIVMMPVDLQDGQAITVTGSADTENDLSEVEGENE